MKTSGSYALVLVTVPNLKTARALATAALDSRLIACASILRGLESHYWWRGKMESGREVLLLLKTVKPRLAALEKLIVSNHPYDTPEFVVMDLCGGNTKYLRWLSDSVGEHPRHKG